MNIIKIVQCYVAFKFPLSARLGETLTAESPQRRENRYHHGDLRSALLLAAEQELQQVGIEGFSLRAVAKRAGVSHAAPAHHYKDVGGLLTALATDGFRRFVDTQKQAMAEAAQDPRSQLGAAGVGYVRFALAHPALFKLIFASDRPDFDDTQLSEAAIDGFQMLVEQVAEITGSDPMTDPARMTDVVSVWAMVHGLADLLVAGRLKPLEGLPQPMREKVVASLVRRALGKWGEARA